MEKKDSQFGSKELEFAIFCIENIALKLHLNPKKVYKILKEETDIMDNYIIPEYEVLHTQDKDYIVEDIIETMKDKGIRI